MANTAITLTELSLNTFQAKPAGTAINASNTMVITPTGPWSKLLVRLTNTTSSTKTWTVVAGDDPPADAAGQGNLTVDLTDGSTTPQETWVVLESSRFAQDDGTVHITVASSTTGNIAAFQLP